MVDPAREYRLGGSVYVLEDPSGELTIDQVSSRAYEDRFRPSEKPLIGVTTSAFWLRVRLKDASTVPTQWVLNLPVSPPLGRVEFYLPQRNGGFEVQAAGRQLPRSAQDLWAIFPAFRLPADLDGERRFYLRITSSAPLALAVSVQAMPLLFERERRAHQRWGFAGGVLAMLSVALALIYAAYRENAALYMGVAFATWTFTCGVSQGFVGQALWPEQPQWSWPAVVIGAVLYNVAIVLFSCSVLSTRKFMPKLHWTVLGCTALYVAVRLIVAWRPEWHTSLGVVPGMLLIGAMGAAAVLRLRQGFRPAMVMIVSWFPLALCLIPMHLAERGLLAFSTALHTLYAVSLAVFAMWIGVLTWVMRTKRRAATAELVNARKMDALGRLVAGVAHDFNNILTVINGQAEFALQDASPADPKRNSLIDINVAGHRAAQVVEQLMAFSRNQKLKVEPVSIHQLLEGNRMVLEGLAGDRVELVVRPLAAEDVVKGNPTQFLRVLVNLVVNASEAMPSGGVVTIETNDARYVDLDDRRERGADSYLLLKVTDTGKGIDRSFQESIFDPFFTTKPSGGGSGLGLATIHGIVGQAGGWLEVESEPGQGACFKIYLPRARETAPRAKEKAPRAKEEPSAAEEEVSHAPIVSSPAEQSGDRLSETVLLVEDRQDVRDLVSAALRRAGCWVLEADSGAAAVAAAEGFRSPIGLLITDVAMPGMDGKDLAARMRRLAPEIGVLFISGYHQHDLESLTGEQPVAFLAKPFTLDELTAKVRDVLTARKQWLIREDAAAS